MSCIKELEVNGLIIYQVIIRDMVMTQTFSRAGANSYILRMIAKLK